MHSRFYNFLTNHGHLTDFQSGFRWFRSCELAVIINLTDNILDYMDRGLLSELPLIDLKKAFDLVDHRTLFIWIYPPPPPGGTPI